MEGSDMITISVPERVKRGESFRGRCEIQLEKEVACREIVLYLECRMTYPNPCVSNFGESWTQEFRTTNGISAGMLRFSSFDFEFRIPENAPPTYAGKALSCRWFVKTKIDVPWAFDINAEKEVVVDR